MLKIAEFCPVCEEVTTMHYYVYLDVVRCTLCSTEFAAGDILSDREDDQCEDYSDGDWLFSTESEREHEKRD